MLYYISHGQFPSRKAHTIQMVRMCEAFAKSDCPTTLVHPSYGAGELSFEEIEDYYGIEQGFQIKTLPSFAGKNSVPYIPTSGEVTTYLWLTSQALRGKVSATDIVYSRYIVPTYAFLRTIRYLPDHRQPTVIYEQHNMKPDHPLATERFFNSLDGVVCIAEQLRERMIDTHKIPPKRVFTAHDGVDLSRYQGVTTQSARERLDLPQDEKIVMYTGHLYRDKQVEVLVDAAEDIDASVYIVGGYDEDISRIRNSVSGRDAVIFTGFVEPAEIVYYQCAADVLVATVDPNAEYFSPLKLFEYMAAGKPIVATRTPAFEEVLTDGENCLYLPSMNPEETSRIINQIIDNESLASRMGETNFKDVEQFTWGHRAESILGFVDRICDP